jgi:hypothetical protein
MVAGMALAAEHDEVVEALPSYAFVGAVVDVDVVVSVTQDARPPVSVDGKRTHLLPMLGAEIEVVWESGQPACYEQFKLENPVAEFDVVWRSLEHAHAREAQEVVPRVVCEWRLGKCAAQRHVRFVIVYVDDSRNAVG